MKTQFIRLPNLYSPVFLTSFTGSEGTTKCPFFIYENIYSQAVPTAVTETAITLLGLPANS